MGRGLSVAASLSSAAPLRAAAEALSIALACWLVYPEGAAALLCWVFALRLRLLDSPLGELGMALLLLLLFPSYVAGGAALLRLGKYTWRTWDHRRRHFLVWELTHWFGFFLLMVLGLSLAGWGIATRAIGNDPNPRAALHHAWSLMVLADGALLVLVILLFSPLALFPYFVSQRITRRIQELGTAAAALRGGDYTVRAQVRGGDEVARLQADFNAMAAALQANAESRRVLFAGVSHELRTPITTLKSYLDVAQKRPDLPDDLRAELAILWRESQRLETLVDDLFTLARAEVGQLALHMGAVDVRALLKAVVSTSAPLIWERRRVEVSAKLPRRLPPAHADPARLEQILLNLIDNAEKHTPPGGAIMLAARAAGGMLTIQVRDTGAGIPAEVLPHIWERFYTDGGGLGMGLVLVKALAEGMGGGVSVSSEPDDGTCFEVTLPISRPATTIKS